MATLIKCDVCSGSINERSAAWLKITTHRGVNPREHHVCSAECGETFLLRQRATRPDFVSAHKALAEARHQAIAESWDNEAAS